MPRRNSRRTSNTKPETARSETSRSETSRSETTGPGQVQSVLRTLAILRTLAESGEGITLGDIAQIVGLATSTAHRLLTTLETAQFVRYLPGDNLWQIGVGAFIVGNAFARTRDVFQLARPHMRRLMEDSGETVNLYVEEGGEAICLGQVECRQMMRAISRPGGRVLLHCSGAGKAMLAHSDKDHIRGVLQRHRMPRLTANTCDTPRKLLAALETVRERGFAVDDEEHALGMRCVAAPLFDEHGAPIAAISLSGPIARIDDSQLALLGARVRDTARLITRQIGGSLP